MSVLKLFPLIIEKRLPQNINANNNRWRITISPDARPKGAILCQERFEWGYKWLRFGRSLDRVEMELMGHAIESHVAATLLGFNLDLYEYTEALNLVDHYAQFAARNAEDVRLALVERRTAAAEWCEQHKGFVQWAVQQNN